MEYTLHSVITEDFQTMHEMLNEIEIKLLGVDPITQINFYSHLKNIIYEAYCDTCNPKDDFLYKKETK